MPLQFHTYWRYAIAYRFDRFMKNFRPKCPRLQPPTTISFLSHPVDRAAYHHRSARAPNRHLLLSLLLPRPARRRSATRAARKPSTAPQARERRGRPRRDVRMEAASWWGRSRTPWNMVERRGDERRTKTESILVNKF